MLVRELVGKECLAFRPDFDLHKRQRVQQVAVFHVNLVGLLHPLDVLCIAIQQVNQLRPAVMRTVSHDGVAVQFRRLRHLADVNDKWGPGAHDRKQAAEFPHVCDIDATQLRQLDFQNQVHHFLYLRQVVDVLFQNKGVVAFF